MRKTIWSLTSPRAERISGPENFRSSARKDFFNSIEGRTDLAWRRLIELCRKMGLLATASVAIDGSKFKAVNNRDKNFTRAKVERRRAQLEESVARYLSQLDTADRQEPTEALATKVIRLTEKLTKLKEEIAATVTIGLISYFRVSVFMGNIPR